jgi:fructose/tagatose bisphosphate aldolase
MSKKYYPNFKIVRTVVLYGSKEKEIIEIEVGFLLNEPGDLILGVKAPALFKQAIKNLLDFWK